MIKLTKSVLLLALLSTCVFSQVNRCQGFVAKDLLQSGKYQITNTKDANIDHEVNFPIAYKMPSWGADIAATTATIGDYQPQPAIGYNYLITTKIDTQNNKAIINIVQENDASWTTLQVSYLITSRDDVLAANVDVPIDSWSSPKDASSVAIKLDRKPLDRPQAVAVFISGFSTTDSSFILSLNRRAFNKETQKVEIGAFLGAQPPILAVGMSIILYTRENLQLDMGYYIGVSAQTGAYQISGPVNFQPSKRIEYNQFRIENRNYVCTGSKCSRGGCELREDCVQKGGNIYQEKCFYCDKGVFEAGRCNERCGENMVYFNRICICADGYKRDGKVCVPKERCEPGKVFNEILKVCECAPGYYITGNTCTACPGGSVSNGDKTGCICSDPGYEYRLYTNTCVSKCRENQYWKDNKCYCNANYSWYKDLCRKCPEDAYESPAQDNCICKLKNFYFNFETNTCVQCGDDQIANDQKTGCTCKTGFYFNDGFCIPQCPKEEFVPTGKRVCECKPGLERGPDGVCKSKCLDTETWTGVSCVCATGYISLDKSCKLCPKETIPNGVKTTCICSENAIFNMNSFSCVKCAANSSPNTDRTKCLCDTGFVNKNDACVPDCKATEIFDYTAGVCVCRPAYIKNDQGLCVFRCKGNQDWVNNACVCPAGTAYYGGNCVKCPVGSVPNDQGTKCICGSTNVNANINTYQILDVNQFVCVNCQPYSKPSGDLTTCICNDGYVLSGSKCILNCGANELPNDIAGRCDCIYGFKRVDNICEPICRKANMEWNGKGCVCKNGMGFRYGECIKCPEFSNSDGDSLKCKCITSSFFWSEQQFKCTLCPVYSRTLPSDNTRCVCDKGYEKIQEYCAPICEPNYILNADKSACVCKYGYKEIAGQCSSICGINEEYTNEKCVCKENYIKSSGVCRPCPDSTEGTNPARTTCVCKKKTQLFNIKKLECANIPENSILNDDFTDFKCLPGFERVNDICRNTCPVGASPDPYGKCACGSGYYFEGNVCKKPVTCPLRSTWDATKLVCVCDNIGENIINGICQKCKANSVFNVGSNSCVCNTNFFLIANECKVCDTKTVYNGVDCICNIGFYGNRDLCNACHSSCATCTGPEANQCLTCSDVSLVLEKGYCQKYGACDPGYFVGQTGCESCVENCIICKDIFSCDTCARGYRKDQVEVEFQNVTTCLEICGDGIRFEQQCDDGNTQDGDGCSSKCKIEPNYSCQKGSSSSKSVCNKISGQVSVITSKNSVSLGNKIMQSYRVDFLPECATKNDCVECSKIIETSVINAIVPVRTKITYNTGSRYQWVVEYEFVGAFVPSTIEVVTKFADQFKGCLADEDYDQKLRLTLNPEFLAKVDQGETLSLNKIKGK